MNENMKIVFIDFYLMSKIFYNNNYEKLIIILEYIRFKSDFQHLKKINIFLCWRRK